MHVQEADLLEVRHRYAPAALEVRVKAVLDDLPQGTLRGVPLRKLRTRVLGEVSEFQPQRVGHHLGHGIVRQPLRVPVKGVTERPTELGDLNEVVEVPRLQRRVLPVVDEGKELAGLRRQVLRVEGA